MRLYPLADKAAAFAKEAHSSIGQVRKYTGEPYHEHPYSVAQRVSEVHGVTDRMLAAAYLHDVLEDTPTTLFTLSDEFGYDVSNDVIWLSDIQTPADGNRAERKERERLRLSTAPDYVQTIKLADLIDNAESIITHDPDFARVFVPEMRAILEVMDKGDQYLDQQAWDIVHQYEAKE